MWKLNHHGILYGLKIKDVAGGELTHSGRDEAHCELYRRLLNFVTGERRIKYTKHPRGDQIVFFKIFTKLFSSRERMSHAVGLWEQVKSS